jgi:hypothetical protein
VPAHAFALIHLALGEKDQALDWLEKAVRDHDGVFSPYFNVQPYLDPSVVIRDSRRSCEKFLPRKTLTPNRQSNCQ